MNTTVDIGGDCIRSRRRRQYSSIVTTTIFVVAMRSIVGTNAARRGRQLIITPPPTAVLAFSVSSDGYYSSSMRRRRQQQQQRWSTLEITSTSFLPTTIATTRSYSSQTSIYYTTSALQMVNPKKIVARVVRERSKESDYRRGAPSSTSTHRGGSSTSMKGDTTLKTFEQHQPSSSIANTRTSSKAIAIDNSDEVVMEVIESHPSSISSFSSSSSLTSRAATNTAKINSSSSMNKKSNTGRLRLLPPLQPACEILARASKQTYYEIKDDVSIVNVKRRTQKKGAQTIDLLAQKLCMPLREAVQTYERELRYMHPFETVVMELTIRARQKKDGVSLSSLLDEIHDGRKELYQLAKDWITKIKDCPTTKETYDCTEEAKTAIGKTFIDLIDVPWTGVMELQRSLRNAPVVRLDCPAVVLVGAPNVGKSSIVRTISSGTPEVNNYPFTTRGVTLGHVRVFWENERAVSLGQVAGVSIPSEKQLIQERLVKGRKDKNKKQTKDNTRDDNTKEKKQKNNDGDNVLEDDLSALSSSSLSMINNNESIISDKIFPISQLCQIMDSPGVLHRRDGQTRNEMEELTLAAMSHLPTAVMYVMDLSGGAGDKCSSVEDQLLLRKELRARYPRRPWIDVISKVDLGVVDGAVERLLQIIESEKKMGSGSSGNNNNKNNHEHGIIELSIKEGVGVEELRQEVMRMLGEVRVVLDAMSALDERSARAV
jgi:GTP1/Obg family GTP-binding protein